VRNIQWNKLAVLDYNNNIDYLLKEWSVTEAQVFIDEVDEIIHVLKLGKVEYQSTNYIGIKRCVLRKQITLFYKVVDKNTIELLRFWNNYQDDKKLKL
jgi:hypothetical protein